MSNIRPSPAEGTWDAGRRRYLCFSFDFDTRAALREGAIQEGWDDQARKSFEKHLSSLRRNLAEEFGEHDLDRKIENFKAIGTIPLSVLSYHNTFFRQLRAAYVVGAYYPALVGACTLGERILNHLMLDLREFYKETEQYTEKVASSRTFDNWPTMINALEAWGVLLPDVTKEFRALYKMRGRSVHFNIKTPDIVNDDALAAIRHLRSIIEQQFAGFGRAPWIIPGTLGHAFIRKEFETNPFVMTYFLPNFNFVGPLFGMAWTPDGWLIDDHRDYGDGIWTDEEFAREFNERDPAKVVAPPPSAGQAILPSGTAGGRRPRPSPPAGLVPDASLPCAVTKLRRKRCGGTPPAVATFQRRGTRPPRRPGRAAPPPRGSCKSHSCRSPRRRSSCSRPPPPGRRASRRTPSRR